MPDMYFLIIGMILATLGAGCLAVKINRRISCPMKISAVVLSVQKKKSGYWRGKTFYQYFPTVTYQIQGKSYTVKFTDPLKSAKTYHKGDNVVIRCDPQAPEHIDMAGGFSAYIGSSLILAFGAILIICYFM